MISCIYTSSCQRSPKVKKLFPLEREARHHLLNYTLAAVTANLIRFLLHSVIQFITSISAGLIPSNISEYPPAVPFATQDDTSFILLYWTTEQPSLFQMLWTGGREDQSQDNSALRPQEHFLRSRGGASKMLCSEDIPVCSKVMSNESMRNFDLGSLLEMNLVR